MVAVIAGNGLGLLGTSLQQLGLSPGGQPGLGQSGASQYVNIATGNLVLQSQDERLVEQGLLAGLVRTYNSLGTSGDIGNAGGWLLGLDRKLSPVTGTVNTVGSTITRDGGDGEEEVFTYDDGRGLYVASNESGADDTLQQNADGTWTYTAGGTRNQEIYGPAGVLTKLVDGKSGAYYDLKYDFQGRLKQVTASDGEELELGYTGFFGNSKLTSLSILEIPPDGGTAVTQSRVTYDYDDAGRLTTVTTDLTPDDTTDSSIFSTSYIYDGDSSRIATLTQSDGLHVSYTYAQDDQSNYRIASVQTGEGDSAQKLSFIYDTANGTTTVTDAANQAWVYTYDADGNLTSIASPPVNGQAQTTRYGYTDGHLTLVTDALGHQTTYEYDAHGNRTLERDADGNTIKWTYNDDDEVLTRTVYQVPDPDGAGPELASVPSTTWYVYDDGTTDALGKKDQLRYVIDADGNVSETQYNANGQISLTRSFAGAGYDTSSLSESTVPTLSAMNTWASSQDLTRTTRVDYSYDTAGRLSQKIAWDTVNPDGSGQGDNGESITQYVYDAQGLLRQQVTVRGSTQEAASYSYDGMGRLIGSTDAMGGITTYAYSGDVASGSGTLTITQSVRDGVNRIRTEVRNSAGELVTVTESASDGSAASRTTNYTYDAEGHLRAVQDPSGAISYTFYDEAGRISGTVDAMGAVTQYVRDADGRVVETTQYANPTSTAGWLSNGALTPAVPDFATLVANIASPGSDRATLSLYDAAGQHVADVDGQGDVTTYGYDGAGNLTTTTQYATALTPGQLSALQGGPSWSTLQGDLSSITSANDRINRTFYDIANRAVATLDAAGYLTTTAYDAAGRVIKMMAHATALTGLGSQPSLSDITGAITPSADDQATRNFYDDRGQLIAQLDADGYLTTTAYDETANTTTITRYALQLTGLTGNETLATLIGDVSDSPSQTRVQQYDADGRLSSTTDVDGTVTTYTYDLAGNLLSTTITPTSGAGAARTSSATYDASGDVLTATDAAGATTTYTYNLLGQKVLATDALGNNTWFFYDADGRLTYTVKGTASGSTQNALGEVAATTYNALGQVTGTTRYAGRLDLTSLALTTTTSLNTLANAIAAVANSSQDAASTYTYTLNGLTASIQDALGYTKANAYDALGELIQTQRQLTSAQNTTTTYSYDARGERIGEVDDAGGLNRTTGVTYDAFGRVTSRTDGNGNITSYSYDALGRQISVSDIVQGTARTEHTTYDAYGRVLTVTDALNNTTTYQYSADTHTVTVTMPDDVKLITTKDAYGDTLSVTDSLNDTTSYTYDSDGRLLSKTDALGNVTTNAYDADGDLTSSTDANGVVTTYTYDAAGRMLTRTVDAGDSSHLNLITSYAYDGLGKQVSVTDPNGVLTTYSYDADGDVLTTVKDAGVGNLNLTTTYTWDGTGHQLTVTEGADTSVARTTQYTYDNLGRLITTQVDPSGLNLTTRYSYDANNNLITRTDSNGNITRYVYNEANERVFTIDAAGNVTQNWYDADGQQTGTTAYATALTAAQLGTLGANPSLTQVQGVISTSANDQSSYIVYNDAGQVGYTIDAKGYVTLTRHDQDGRDMEVLSYANAISLSSTLKAALQQGGGTVYASITSAVSAAGNTDQNARASLNLYDAEGQTRFVVRQNWVNNQLVGIVTEKRYDAGGQVIAAVTYDTTLPLNATSRISDQLTTSSVTQALAGSSSARVTQYVYDAAGRVAQQISPPVAVSKYTTGNSISTSTASIVTQFTYDADGNVTSRKDTDTAGTASRTTAYAYDHLGNQTKVTYPDGSYAQVTYDALGRAVVNRDVKSTASSAIYEYKVYDNAGRLAYDIDGNGYLTAYSYDANGNQTQVTRYATALNFGAITGGWSAGHALSATQVKQGLVINGDDRTLTTTYDPLNRKTQIQQSTIYALYTSGPNAFYSLGSYAANVGANAQPATTYTYDAFGNVTSTSVLVQPAIGTVGQSGYYSPVWATTYDYYDARNQKTLEVDPMGYVTTWTYDMAGAVKSDNEYATAISTSGLSVGTPLAPPASSVFDRIMHYGYDSLGRKTNEIDYGGYSSEVNGAQSIAQGQIDKVFTYDNEGRVIAAYVNGATTTTTYDALGRVISVLQPARSVLKSNWQALLTAPTPLDLTDASLYESASPRTTITYDAFGNALSSTTTTAGAAGGSQVTYSHYDALGHETSTVDANGTTYTNTYDAAGNLLTTAYTLTGNSGSSTVTTTYTYDADNQRLSSITKRGATAEAATYVKYNAFGEVSAKGDSSTNYEITYLYKHTGQLINQTDAKTGATHTYFYDLAGNVVEDAVGLHPGTDPSHTAYSMYTYDLDGRRIRVNAPSPSASSGQNASSISYTYDRWGNVLSTTDARGYVTTYEYDSQDHLIKQIEPQVMVVATNGVRTFQAPTKAWYYDVNGRLTGVTDENGHTSTNAYDPASGELVSSTDAVGAITYYAYDGLGRQVAKQSPPAASGLKHITWQDLDALGRVIQEGDFLLNGSSLTKSIQQTYVLDQDGNRIKVTDAIGNYSLYTYDSEGRMLSSQTPTQRVAGKYHRYTYDTNGNKTSETTADGDTESWTYDYFGRVLTQKDLSGANYTYTYDANSGLLTQETSTWSSGETDPAYVPSQDKGSGSTEIYTYYADGQVASITQKTGTSTTTTTTYQYDADGNETDQNTQAVDGAGAVVDTDIQSTYDSHNRLSEVTEIENGVGATRTVYNYDAAGNRRAVFVQSAYDGTAINTGTIGAPTASASSTTVQPGAVLNFNAAAHFSDKLGFGLTYTATGLPSWMHISTTGVLSGTAPKPAESWTVTVTATDALGKSVSANVTVTVPVVNPVFSGTPPTLTWQTGTAHSYTGPAATDANGSPISYQATYNNGSTWTATLPSWLTFNASTRTFSGTPPTGSAGTYTLALNAYPADGGHAAWIFTVNVTQTPTPPAYNGGIGTIFFTAGTSNSWSVPKTAFTTSDGGGLSYSIKKSDGSALPSIYSFNATTGALTVTLTAHNQDTWFDVIITATDTKNGLSTNVTTEIYITGSGGGMQAVPVGGGANISAQTAEYPGAQLAPQDLQQQTTLAANVQANWFTYDADNRVDVSGGDLTNGQIVVSHSNRESREEEYDAAGNVTTELSFDGQSVVTQTFYYNARGEVTGSGLPYGMGESRQYDADGRLIADVYYYAHDVESWQTADGPETLDITGWMSSATTYYYDADGRVIATYNYGRPNVDWKLIKHQIDNGIIDPLDESNPPANPPSASAAAANADYGLLQVVSRVAHGDPSTGAGGYDSEGNALAYSSSVLDPNTGAWTETDYTVTYLKKDGYLEKATTGSGSGLVTTTDTSYYDNFGRRIAIATQSGSTTTDVRAFAYDANGQILAGNEGPLNSGGTGITPSSGYNQNLYAYVQGQQAGHVDKAGTIDVLSGVTNFSNTEQGSTGYVVREGDTLQSIAQAVYGDSSLWYVVADANALASDGSDLVAGQTLKLPQVKTENNTANTFKPYNPLEISGSTTPALPQAPQPPPSAQHCSTLAMIVVIAVVVVASIFTAGVAAEAFAGTLGTAAGGGAAGIMAAGGAALTGGTVIGATGAALGAGELMGAAAIGGAVGNAAGQLVGDAEGIHQGFSWGEMLGAGLGAGITAGLGNAISGGASITKLAGEDSLIADAKIAGIGAAGSVANYAGEKLAGQPAHFSWANVAAAAISTEITAQVHLPTNTQLTAGESSGHFVEDLGGSLVNGAIDSETARLLGGDAQNGRQIAEDAFGNALGNAAIAGIEHVNEVEAENQARANLQPATIESQPIQVKDLVPDHMTVSPVSSDYIVQDGASVGIGNGAADEPSSSSSDFDSADYNKTITAWALQNGLPPPPADMTSVDALKNFAGTEYVDGMVGGGFASHQVADATAYAKLGGFIYGYNNPNGTDSNYIEVSLSGDDDSRLSSSPSIGSNTSGLANSQGYKALLGYGQTPEFSLGDLNEVKEVANDVSLGADAIEVVGHTISKLEPLSKFAKPLGIAADAAYLYADVKQAPSDQVPLVIARDTTSFAGDAIAIETGMAAGFEFGMWLGVTGPVLPAAFTIGGGLVGLAVYNFLPAEKYVKEGVSTLVNGADNVIENPQIIVDDAKASWNQFKSDAKDAGSYLQYLLLPYPKGPYRQ